jgi:hypothetical protein
MAIPLRNEKDVKSPLSFGKKLLCWNSYRNPEEFCDDAQCPPVLIVIRWFRSTPVIMEHGRKAS